jgi:type IV secretory pathway TrbF-like protein
VSDQTDAVLAFWNEHRVQARQSEDQRALLTNYVLVIASALIGLAVQQRLHLATLPLAFLVMLIGLYGAITVAKYHERAEYHLMQARALTKTLTDLGALPADEATLDQYRQDHYAKYPRLHRIRLHLLWTGLHAAIAAFGLALAITILAIS